MFNLLKVTVDIDHLYTRHCTICEGVTAKIEALYHHGGIQILVEEAIDK